MFGTLKTALRRPFEPTTKMAADASGRLWLERQFAWECRNSPQEFAALATRKGNKINLGCGTDLRTGWVNVDLFTGPAKPIDPAAQPDTVLIRHDLRTGVPLPPESCDLIYSSHVFEHLSFTDGLKLMQDCYRALRPGGVFRTVLPDFRACFEAYLRNDAAYFAPLDQHKLLEPFKPEHHTIVDYINYVCYQWGEHVAIYDHEKLAKILTSIGYRTVEASTHDPELDPGSELRKHFSFYSRAVK